MSPSHGKPDAASASHILLFVTSSTLYRASELRRSRAASITAMLIAESAGDDTISGRTRSFSVGWVTASCAGALAAAPTARTATSRSILTPSVLRYSLVPHMGEEGFEPPTSCV